MVLGDAEKIEFHCSESCLYFVLILLAVVLLVWTWRHGGHVGGQEQKDFSPLGTKLYFRYFHVNSSEKILLFWPPKLPGRLVVENQETDLYCSTPYIILKFSYLQLERDHDLKRWPSTFLD